MLGQQGGSAAPPCDEGLGRGEVVGRGEKTSQGERAKGGRAGVAKRCAGDARRARVSSDKRDKRGKKGEMQAKSRGMAAQGGRDAEAELRQIGAPHRAQSDAMAMTRIEPYRPPRPAIRELMEGRPAGADDGGIPPNGEPGEAAQVGLQDGGQGAGGETREGAQDTALARRGAAERTRCRGAAVRGRARDRRQGKGEGRGEGEEWSVTRGRCTHVAWPGTAKGHTPRRREDQRRTQRGAVT